MECNTVGIPTDLGTDFAALTQCAYFSKGTKLINTMQELT